MESRRTLNQTVLVRSEMLSHSEESGSLACVPAIAALNEELYRVASEWLEGHVRAGRIRALSPRMFQALWMGATLEYARLWMANPTSPADLVAAGDALARAAWDAVRGRRS